MNLRWTCSCFVCFGVLLVPNLSLSADWQQALEAQFDIVETFDQLQDWRGGNYTRGRNLDQANMPKKLDGSISIWNMFDYWPTEPSPNDWIAHHSDADVWRATGKSLRMTMWGTTGPGRLGAYFGGSSVGSIDPYSTSGVVTSGYQQDVYLFEMIKFEPNAFPKDADGNYAYYAYFKWFVLSTGNTAANVCVEGRDDCTYGASNVHTMLYRNVDDQQFKLEYYNDANWPDFPADFQMWKPLNNIGNLKEYIENERWFGLEVHVHMGTPGQYDGYQEYWIYDDTGTEHYVGKSQGMIMMTAAPGHEDWGFNYFFQGGNISYGSVADEQGLDVSFFVDDIIIDDQRIGPAYFQLLSGNAVNSMNVTDVEPSPGIWLNN
ncbi:hypothetical protein GF1_00550 [Desulfolithobacter dissulfuricans]|uniref:Uncharacterized protein n=1 Tax=Desulfolithobacter dissulfuricans TaxID=2795293 RepID=A0A915TXQ3_9BACT|nr:hypothetical protein [Desulfolithobacter dissulfuricans]BCO07679.1 hypothetical protein GF1_00550 [Desulfolithobacter dissulfuricans]